MATELQNTQRDVLTQDLNSNPYFKASPIPSKNNLLKTVSKRIIGAINEIVDNMTSTNKSIDNLKSNTEKSMENITKAADDFKESSNKKFDSVDTELEDIKKGVNQTLDISSNVKELSNNLSEVQKTVKDISENVTSTGGTNTVKKVIEFDNKNNSAIVYIPSTYKITDLPRHYDLFVYSGVGTSQTDYTEDKFYNDRVENITIGGVAYKKYITKLMPNFCNPPKSFNYKIDFVYAMTYFLLFSFDGTNFFSYDLKGSKIDITTPEDIAKCTTASHIYCTRPKELTEGNDMLYLALVDKGGSLQNTRVNENYSGYKKLQETDYTILFDEDGITISIKNNNYPYVSKGKLILDYDK